MLFPCFGPRLRKNLVYTHSQAINEVSFVIHHSLTCSPKDLEAKRKAEEMLLALENREDSVRGSLMCARCKRSSFQVCLAVHVWSPKR